MNRTDWNQMGDYLNAVDASFGSCLAVATELAKDNELALQFGDTERHFRARKFMRRCGWHIKPSWHRLYKTREKQAERLAALDADWMLCADHSGHVFVASPTATARAGLVGARRGG